MIGFLYFGIFVAFVWIVTEYYPRWKFRMRYPIICCKFPVGEMRIGDIIVLGKTEYEYRGFDRTYSHDYVFLREGIDRVNLSLDTIRKEAVCLKCRYGIKWTMCSFKFSCEE